VKAKHKELNFAYLFCSKWFKNNLAFILDKNPLFTFYQKIGFEHNIWRCDISLSRNW